MILVCGIVKHVLVTGGAGFIGSHLVESLITDFQITVLDDLSGGQMENIVSYLSNERFKFIKGSICNREDVVSALEGVDTVFHLAAQPDVRISNEHPRMDFEVNVIGSFNLLDAASEQGINRFIFASSGGTVYGEPEKLPTPESTPFRPISNYGAAKGAIEMYLSSYSELYGIDTISMRLANIIGPRLTHGVIFDFFMKLNENPSVLEILGDGSQEKTYLYVSDAVRAFIILASRVKRGFTPINVGSNERLKVTKIAELVIDGLNLTGISLRYAGEKRGWPGDIAVTDMDNNLLKSFGWEQKVSLEKGVYIYIDWLKDTFGDST